MDIDATDGIVSERGNRTIMIDTGSINQMTSMQNRNHDSNIGLEMSVMTENRIFNRQSVAIHELNEQMGMGDYQNDDG